MSNPRSRHGLRTSARIKSASCASAMNIAARPWPRSAPPCAKTSSRRDPSNSS
jgi:hypothetical protein